MSRMYKWNNNDTTIEYESNCKEYQPKMDYCSKYEDIRPLFSVVQQIKENDSIARLVDYIEDTLYQLEAEIEEAENILENVEDELNSLNENLSEATSNQNLAEDDNCMDGKDCDPNFWQLKIHEHEELKESTEKQKDELSELLDLIYDHKSDLEHLVLEPLSTFFTNEEILIKNIHNENNSEPLEIDDIFSDEVNEISEVIKKYPINNLKIYSQLLSAEKFSILVENSFEYLKLPVKGWPFSKQFNFKNNESLLFILINNQKDQIVTASMIFNKSIPINGISDSIQKSLDECKPNKKYTDIYLSQSENVFRHELPLNIFLKKLKDKIEKHSINLEDALYGISLEKAWGNDNVWQYAEKILFPYYCNAHNFPFYYINQSGLHLSKPKYLYSKNQKRPDYVINTNMALPIYIDVKCYKKTANLFTFNYADVQELSGLAPFVFFAVYDKSKVMQYTSQHDLRKSYPIPKFISFSQLKLLENRDGQIEVDENSLVDFDVILDKTILEWFKIYRVV